MGATGGGRSAQGREQQSAARIGVCFCPAAERQSTVPSGCCRSRQPLTALFASMRSPESAIGRPHRARVGPECGLRGLIKVGTEYARYTLDRSAVRHSSCEHRLHLVDLFLLRSDDLAT